MAHSGKPKILIVDDDKENIHTLMAALQEEYSILAALNAEQALAISSTTAGIDLIILDIVMPDMDGYELCTRLRQTPATADVPVIFISVLHNTEDKIRGFELGAQDFITKPFEYDEVHARVRTHVSLYRLQQQLRAQNRRLEDLERLKESLTQMIVHDLRSPLTGALAYLDLLQIDFDKSLDGDAREYLNGAQRSITAICHMVDQLLDVSRLEEQEVPLAREEADLPALCREMIRKNALLAEAHEVRLECPEALKVSCDPGLIERVIQNLLVNAVKFSNDGSRIDIVLRQEEAAVHTVVRDQGCGVPPEDRDRIFDKFYQVESAALGRGSGLGLAFCRLAVEAHGGCIGVANAPGGGAEFWFRLPLRPNGLSSVSE